MFVILKLLHITYELILLEGISIEPMRTGRVSDSVIKCILNKEHTTHRISYKSLKRSMTPHVYNMIMSLQILNTFRNAFIVESW